MARGVARPSVQHLKRTRRGCTRQIGSTAAQRMGGQAAGTGGSCLASEGALRWVCSVSGCKTWPTGGTTQHPSDGTSSVAEGRFLQESRHPSIRSITSAPYVGGSPTHRRNARATSRSWPSLPGLDGDVDLLGTPQPGEPAIHSTHPSPTSRRPPRTNERPNSMFLCLEKTRQVLIADIGSDCRAAEWQEHESAFSLETLTDVLHLLAIEQWQSAHPELSPAPVKRRDSHPQSGPCSRSDAASQLTARNEQEGQHRAVRECSGERRLRGTDSGVESAGQPPSDAVTVDATPTTAAAMACGSADATESSSRSGSSWRLRRSQNVPRPLPQIGMAGGPSSDSSHFYTADEMLDKARAAGAVQKQPASTAAEPEDADRADKLHDGLRDGLAGDWCSVNCLGQQGKHWTQPFDLHASGKGREMNPRGLVEGAHFAPPVGPPSKNCWRIFATPPSGLHGGRTSAMRAERDAQDRAREQPLTFAQQQLMVGSARRMRQPSTGAHLQRVALDNVRTWQGSCNAPWRVVDEAHAPLGIGRFRTSEYRMEAARQLPPSHRASTGYYPIYKMETFGCA